MERIEVIELPQALRSPLSPQGRWGIRLTSIPYPQKCYGTNSTGSLMSKVSSHSTPGRTSTPGSMRWWKCKRPDGSSADARLGQSRARCSTTVSTCAAEPRTHSLAGSPCWQPDSEACWREVHFGPDADPDALAEATIAILQGGYLLTSIKRNVRPMRSAVAAASSHLHSSASP